MLKVLICILVLDAAASLTDQDIQNFMPFRAINYSKPKLDTNFQSEYVFDPQGMEHLYYLTNHLLSLIQKEDPWPDELGISLDLSGDPPYVHIPYNEYDMNTLKSVGRRYIGFAVISVIGIVVAAVLPLAGFIFCCCRCCGKCSGRPDGKEESCKRGFYSFLVSVITVLILFTVVCAFVTNQFMDRGIKDLPNNINYGVHDTDLYLKNSKLEVRHLLVDNFKELQTTLEETLEKSGEIVQNRLAQISKAFAVDSLTVIASELGAIQDTLRDIVNATESLKQHADLLEAGLDPQRYNVFRLKQNCKESCKQYQVDISRVTVLSDYLDLPDVGGVLQTISKLIEQNIKGDVKTGQQAFHNIKERVTQAVQDTLPQVSKAIRRLGNKLESASREVETKAKDLDVHKLSKVSDDLEVYIKEYMPYRYYVGIGVSVLILLIFVLFVCGMFCGICGKRPDSSYSGDSCNKGTAADCLMGGSYLIFLLLWAVILVVVAMFLAGGLSDRILCQGLQHPQNAEIFRHLDEAVKLDDLYPEGVDMNLTLSELIVSCHQNKSLYEVLKLDKLNDLADIKTYHRAEGVDQQIQILKKHMKTVSEDVDVIILSNEAKHKLHMLANSGLSEIDFSGFTAALDEKITSEDLMNLSRVLNNTAALVQPHNKTVANQLWLDALQLETQQRYVRAMQALVRKLKNKMTTLKEKIKFSQIKFNQTNLREAVLALMNQTQDAQTYLASQGRKEVMLLADKFAVQLDEHVDKYIDLLVRSLQHDVGKCGTMSNIFNATTDSVCARILRPFNGFWLAVGSCVILFIVVLPLAVSLAILYRKMDPSYRPVHMDRRWEEGDPHPPGIPPPQYSSHSAEYERPPPYYYPGPSERKS